MLVGYCSSEPNGTQLIISLSICLIWLGSFSMPIAMWNCWRAFPLHVCSIFNWIQCLYRNKSTENLLGKHQKLVQVSIDTFSRCSSISLQTKKKETSQQPKVIKFMVSIDCRSFFCMFSLSFATPYTAMDVYVSNSLKLHWTIFICNYASNNATKRSVIYWNWKCEKKWSKIWQKKWMESLKKRK